MINIENIQSIRNAMAFVMAYAVKQIFGEVKFGTGAATDDGFYLILKLPRSWLLRTLNLIETK